METGAREDGDRAAAAAEIALAKPFSRRETDTTAGTWSRCADGGETQKEFWFPGPSAQTQVHRVTQPASGEEETTRLDKFPERVHGEDRRASGETAQSGRQQTQQKVVHETVSVEESSQETRPR